MAESKVKFHGKPGILPQALCRSRDLSPFAKTVFGLLTTYKEAFPGQPWLADHVPCSEPTVRKAIKELELHGWIKRERRNRRKNETDLYHVYLEAPLEIEDRPQWAQRQLGLPKAHYGNEITVKRLPKLGFGEKLEPSVQVKTSENRSSHSSASRAKKPKVRKAIMDDLCETYARLRGTRPKGNEWVTIQKCFKDMILDGNHQHDIKAVMEWCAANGFTWSMHTIRKWLPDQRAGKLGKPQRGTQQARGRSADEYAGLMKGAE